MKPKAALFIVLCGLISLPPLLFSGCTGAAYQKSMSYGSAHKVTLYSGGVAVRTWTSTGKVLSEEKSDGYYFEDKATGKLVEVAGTIVIERE